MSKTEKCDIETELTVRVVPLCQPRLIERMESAKIEAWHDHCYVKPAQS